MGTYFKNIYYGAYILSYAFSRFAGYIVIPPMRWLIMKMGYIPFAKRNLAKQNMTPEENFSRIKKISDWEDTNDVAGTQRRHAESYIGSFFFLLIFDVAIILKRVFRGQGLFYYISSENGMAVLAIDAIVSYICVCLLSRRFNDIRKLKAFRKKSKEMHGKALLTFLGSFVLSIILLIVFLLMWPHPNKPR